MERNDLSPRKPTKLTGDMPIVVHKYGGTSVADPKRISAVADRVRHTRAAGFDVVVVVSAMGHTTDQLLRLASQISPKPTPRELDMLLTAGERITMALLAMALHEREVPAVSYTGSQAGILTDSSHGEARITRITGERVRQSLEEGKVVIVAGFQGVDPQSKEVTTLGRGGSDTTAVELAATLDAVGCEIYTDVTGVYSADPNVVPGAIKLDSVSYEDMYALSKAGAAVLAPPSVERAQDLGVVVEVRSSFVPDSGTTIGPDPSSRTLVGVAHAPGLVTLVGSESVTLADRVGGLLAARGVTYSSTPGSNTLAIVVPVEQTEDVVRYLHEDLLELETTS